MCFLGRGGCGVKGPFPKDWMLKKVGVRGFLGKIQTGKTPTWWEGCCLLCVCVCVCAAVYVLCCGEGGCGVKGPFPKKVLKKVGVGGGRVWGGLSGCLSLVCV